MIRVATAFSGGLAAVEFALRYEDIEHEIIFACEWDKFARQQYLQFHNEPKTFYKDIQDLDANKYFDQVDLFVWGSPCQDLSLAGKRKGFNGEKSSLFREGARVQNEMMPKNFIFENVKGLLSSNKGADYKEVCDTFRNMGYNIVTLQMNTKDYGVPQNRERIFIVGFLDEEQYHNYKAPVPFKLETRLRDILEDEVDEKYFLSQKIIDGFISGKSIFKDRFNPIDTEIQDYGFCLDCRCGGGRRTSNFIKVKSATKKGYELATENDSINFTHPDSETRRGRVGKGVAQTLDCACNQGVLALKQVGTISKTITKRANETPKEINQFLKDNKGNKKLTEISKLSGIKKTTIEHYFRTDKSRAIPSITDWEILKSILKFDNSFDDIIKETISKESTFESTSRVYSDDVAPTLTCNDGSIHLVDYKIRRLTPKECYRLQGVKDEDINLVVSDTQAYKIAGNAISVNVMQYLLKSLYKQEKKMNNLFDFIGA